MSRNGRVEYLANYIKTNLKRYELRLNKFRDKEIIDHLSKQRSINRYLRNLIELDMKKGTY